MVRFEFLNGGNLIYDAKLCLSSGGYVDSILKLKKGSKYDNIQDSRFPGQGSELAYIFKMSTVGPGSGVTSFGGCSLEGIWNCNGSCLIM